MLYFLALQPRLAEGKHTRCCLLAVQGFHNDDLVEMANNPSSNGTSPTNFIWLPIQRSPQRAPSTKGTPSRELVSFQFCRERTGSQRSLPQPHPFGYYFMLPSLPLTGRSCERVPLTRSFFLLWPIPRAVRDPCCVAELIPVHQIAFVGGYLEILFLSHGYPSLPWHKILFYTFLFCEVPWE